MEIEKHSNIEVFSAANWIRCDLMCGYFMLYEGVGIEIVAMFCFSVFKAVWGAERITWTLAGHFHRCVQFSVKDQTTEPISNTFLFFSLSTLTVCEISLSECENLAWCHLSWWLMRSDKASWDIWHTLSSFKPWNNPNIHTHPRWLAEPVLQILL